MDRIYWLGYHIDLAERENKTMLQQTIEKYYEAKEEAKPALERLIFRLLGNTKFEH